MGKAAVFIGILLGTLFAATSCDHFVSKPQEGDPVETSMLDDLGWDEDEAEDGEYQDVEEMPEFPGGEEKLMEFVQENIKYPQEAIDAGTQGRVFVGFVVEKDGSIGDVKVHRGIGHGCNEEALRVVQMMPKWKPGKNKGEPVEVSFLLPIDFKLE